MQTASDGSVRLKHSGPKHFGMRMVMAGVLSLGSLFSTAKGVPTLGTQLGQCQSVIHPSPFDSVPKPEEIQDDPALLISPAPIQTLCGTTLDVLSPDSSLGALSRGKCRATESSGAGGNYRCVATAGPDTFSVFMNLRQDSMRLDVMFPANGDIDRSADEPGVRKFDLCSFVALVRCLPKTDGWSAMKIFVEKTDGSLNLTSAFMLPVDSDGRAITTLGNGKYLALAVFYYCGCIVEAKPIILREKGGTYSISVAKENK
jgi:hypothetical protein